jgi:hypothetical protein
MSIQFINFYFSYYSKLDFYQYFKHRVFFFCMICLSHNRFLRSSYSFINSLGSACVILADIMLNIYCGWNPKVLLLTKLFIPSPHDTHIRKLFFSDTEIKDKFFNFFDPSPLAGRIFSRKCKYLSKFIIIRVALHHFILLKNYL